MKQIAYVSRAADSLTEEDVRAILQVARERNRDAGVTGLLLVELPLFLQIIEGDGTVVTDLFHRISADERHTDVAVIFENNDVREPEFADWSARGQVLGRRTAGDYRSLDGRVKEILRSSEPSSDLAHDLLMEFQGLDDAFVDL